MRVPAGWRRRDTPRRRAGCELTFPASRAASPGRARSPRAASRRGSAVHAEGHLAVRQGFEPDRLPLVERRAEDERPEQIRLTAIDEDRHGLDQQDAAASRPERFSLGPPPRHARCRWRGEHRSGTSAAPSLTSTLPRSSAMAKSRRWGTDSGIRAPIGSTVAGSCVSTAAFSWGMSAMKRAARPKLSKSKLRYPSTSVAASAMPRCNSRIRLRRHGSIDDVDGHPDREHRQNRRGKEDAVRERRERSHRIVKSASMSPPLSPMVIVRRGASPRTRFVPHRHRVGARRHVLDAIPSVVVGHREITVGEDENEGVHVRMDVAEHADDARPLEAHRFRLARGVAPEIELLRLRERKDVVVGVVVVGEVHVGAGDDGQHVRHETLVALIHPRAAVFALFERGAWRGFEIDDAAPPFEGIAHGGHAQGAGIRAGIAQRPLRTHVHPSADRPGRGRRRAGSGLDSAA